MSLIPSLDDPGDGNPLALLLQLVIVVGPALLAVALIMFVVHGCNDSNPIVHAIAPGETIAQVDAVRPGPTLGEQYRMEDTLYAIYFNKVQWLAANVDSARAERIRQYAQRLLDDYVDRLAPDTSGR